MVLLNDDAIAARLGTIPGWQHENNALRRTFIFRGFPEAVAFIGRLVEPAERLDHHPDITIGYNQVNLALWTHSEGGVTEKDFGLAREIDAVA